MLKLADRVKETSITVGNGLEIALAGAFGAFQTFASTIGDGNSTYYTIENNSNFEVGVGTYNASDNTLSRDLVLSSTNNNQRISLDGVSIVFCCYPASQAVLLDNGRINSPNPNYNGIVFPSSTVIDTALLSGVVSESILPTSVVYSDDSRLSDNRNPNPHTHTISDITALQNALDSKQPTGSYASSVHSHVVSDVQGLQTALDNKQAAGSYAASSHTHTSSQITDFAASVSSVAPPTTNANLLTAGTLSDDRLSNNIVRTSDNRLSDARTPLSHSHGIDDVTNLQSSLDSKQTSGNYAPLSHQHLIVDVSGLQSALNNKQVSGNYAASAHNHNISDVSGLQTALDSKQASGSYAASSHTHAISSVSGLQLTLDGKQPSGSYASLNHTHSIADVSTLQTALDGKQPSGNYAALSHTHLIANVSGLQIALDGKQPSGSYAALSHNHSVADVTGLQTALDGKQPSGSYAASSHSHTASQITDFNTSVSGLVNGIYAPLSSPTFTGTVSGITKTMVGLGNVDNTSDANKPISSATQTALDGKQASGSYAASSHTHTSSNITNFNTSVSGLLPVKDVVPGTNITVTSSSGIYTINSTASGGANQILSYSAVVNFPASGSTSSYYFASDSSRLYQWTGSQYVEMGPTFDTISANNITAGTLSDARLSSGVVLHSQLNTTLGQASGVVDAMSRVDAAAGVTAASNQALLAFFTPTATTTISQISMSNAAGAVSTGLTLARMGLYTYPTEGGTATLVARTASDTSLFATINTTYTRSLDTTGGYPSTYTLVAGTRYAVGYICVGTTQPQLTGRVVLTAVSLLSPRLSGGSSTGLSDLPTSFTPNGNSQAPFARLL
jgi:hypothetical protein